MIAIPRLIDWKPQRKRWELRRAGHGSARALAECIRCLRQHGSGPTAEQHANRPARDCIQTLMVRFTIVWVGIDFMARVEFSAGTPLLAAPSERKR
jgi:hypothetical protein